MSENVRVYLIDRAGAQANAFAGKLAGREGIEMVGGAADVEEALGEISEGQPDVVLVGTDLGGAGVVAAVERVLSLASETAVVALCTRADKALVDAAVRVGAAGSLDRAASDVDTITALHTYRDRQHGVHVDMKLAEPPAEHPGLRVSGALPRFPAPVTPEISYLNEQPRFGAKPTPEAEALPEPGPIAEPLAAAAEYVPAPEPGPQPAPEYSPQPEPAAPPPEYAPHVDPTPAPEYAPPEPAAPDPVQPEAEAAEPVQSSRPAGMDADLHQMREMLRGEAAAAHGSAPKPKRRGLFGRRKEKSKDGKDKESPWGPRDGQDEGTEPS